MNTPGYVMLYLTSKTNIYIAPQGASLRGFMRSD